LSNPRVLFILKRRQSYGGYGTFSSGLLNSAQFVSDMLNASGVDSRLVVVVDNNDIDREVHKYKPSIVIIEALWVVPEKFEILQKLHPSVKWIVRGHSEIPFLANEGIAVDWIKKYVTYKNVQVASNSVNSVRDLKIVVGSCFEKKIVYLPNYYPVPKGYNSSKSNKYLVNIGCFGAIRPLKNQLIQALAAIEYGNKTGKIVFFHINATRTEQRGDGNLENIRSLFRNTRHFLVEHPWLDHEDFLKLLRDMDVSMCVSFTESFCLVAADTVASGVPLVCSFEIPWAVSGSMAHPTDSKDITGAIERVTGFCKRRFSWFNFRNLKKFSDQSRKIWLQFVGS
jgi:hypothetical protein